jgi:hypothetical protein
VKAPQHVGEHGAGAKTSLDPRRAENVEECRRDDGAERDDTAHPHRETQQRGVAQREHPVIIIVLPPDQPPPRLRRSAVALRAKAEATAESAMRA